MKIITRKISFEDLKKVAEERFGDLVKAVVDVELEIMALGGELHADEEALLLQNGSQQKNLWGINLYPANSGEDFVEFDSMINIRPGQGNRSRSVEDESLRHKIVEIVKNLVE
ncbi:MAG: hypothetical protein HY982_02685 [Candidatus Magasanikbacteria bacterium]|nr:hypothetical protein [Candidatus Magasanikbacteria bacterium]